MVYASRMATKLLRLVHDKKKKEASDGGTCISNVIYFEHHSEQQFTIHCTSVALLYYCNKLQSPLLLGEYCKIKTLRKTLYQALVTFNSSYCCNLHQNSLKYTPTLPGHVGHIGCSSSGFLLIFLTSQMGRGMTIASRLKCLNSFGTDVHVVLCSDSTS